MCLLRVSTVENALLGKLMCSLVTVFLRPFDKVTHQQISELAPPIPVN